MAEPPRRGAAGLPDGPRGRLLALALTVLALALLLAGPVAQLHAALEEGEAELEARHVLARRLARAAAEAPGLRRRAAERAEGEAAPSPLLDGATDAIAAAALQERLTDLAGSLGLRLGSVEIIPGEEVARLRRIGLRMTLDAGWPALAALLRALAEGTPRLLVDDLQLRALPPAEDDAAPPLQASLTVTGFREAGPAGDRRNDPAGDRRNDPSADRRNDPSADRRGPADPRGGRP